MEGSKSLLLELEFSTPQGAKGRWPSRPRGPCQISVSLGFRSQEAQDGRPAQDAKRPCGLRKMRKVSSCSTRAPGLRRRAKLGLAKGCQQHQLKVIEGFGYTVASLPCSEHTHSHLAGQPSSGSGHLRPSGRSGRETTARRARGPLAPAFRPSELRSVCPRPARRATGVARATLFSSGAPAQPAQTP